MAAEVCHGNSPSGFLGSGKTTFARWLESDL